MVTNGTKVTVNTISSGGIKHFSSLRKWNGVAHIPASTPEDIWSRRDSKS
jgi:hypothetical protein